MTNRKVYSPSLKASVMTQKWNLEKHTKASFKRDELTNMENIMLGVDTAIHDLEKKDTYKNLGINGDGIRNAKMEEKIQKEY